MTSQVKNILIFYTKDIYFNFMATDLDVHLMLGDTLSHVRCSASHDFALQLITTHCTALILPSNRVD